jgi:hypothetical protein
MDVIDPALAARALALAIAVASLATPAAAQDVAAAEALFNQGFADMDAGRYESGCPALAESYRLDPRPGALFTLAECENKRGRIATAVARYEEYLRLVATLPADQRARQAEREQIARRNKTALEPDVPRLTLRLPEDAPAGTIVTRGGVALGAAALGVALPVDPGVHVVTTQAPGGPVGEERISVARGERKAAVLSVDVPGARGAPVATKAALPMVPALASAPEREEAPPGSSPQRAIGFVVGAVGVAGLLVGSITGGLAIGEKGTVDDNCDGPACNQEGKDAADAVKDLGLVSTIGFVAGGAALATGVVLVLTAPDEAPSASARVRLHGTGLEIGGVW